MSIIQEGWNIGRYSLKMKTVKMFRIESVKGDNHVVDCKYISFRVYPFAFPEKMGCESYKSNRRRHKKILKNATYYTINEISLIKVFFASRIICHSS